MQTRPNRRVIPRAIIGAVFLALVAGVGCGTDDDEVRRQVELAPAAHEPTGTSEMDVDHLIVEVTGLEPLAEGQYVVWADWRASPEGPESLGVVSAEGELSVETPRDDDGQLPHELLVTEETGGEPFDEPSEDVRLRGALGEDLQFPGNFAGEVEEAQGAAQLRGHRARVEAAGLPAAPAGMHYEMWVLWFAEGAEGDGHGHRNASHAIVRQAHGDEDHSDEQDAGMDDHSEGEDDHSGDDETEGEDHAQFHNPATGSHHDVGHRVQAGRLGSDGHLEHTSERMLADADAVVVSLESERGDESRSPITVMAGAIDLPESSDDGHGHLH